MSSKQTDSFEESHQRDSQTSTTYSNPQTFINQGLIKWNSTRKAWLTPTSQAKQSTRGEVVNKHILHLLLTLILHNIRLQGLLI